MTLDTTILEKARKLHELEKQFLKQTNEAPTSTEEQREVFLKTALSISIDAFDLKNEIATEFFQTTDYQVYDETVKIVLNKIKNNEEFASIGFYENCATILNLKEKNYNKKWDLTVRDYMIKYMLDELEEEYRSYHHPMDYFCAKIELGPIISSSAIPKNILKYFEEIRDSYAFELYRSAIALCRALLEMALFDKLKRKGLFKDQNSKVKDFNIEKEDKLHWLIYLAKRNGLINVMMKDKATGIKNKANKIMHLKDNEIKVSKDDAFNIIVDTIRVLEYLYN